MAFCGPRLKGWDHSLSVEDSSTAFMDSSLDAGASVMGTRSSGPVSMDPSMGPIAEDLVLNIET